MSSSRRRSSITARLLPRLCGHPTACSTGADFAGVEARLVITATSPCRRLSLRRRPRLSPPS
jgi:hypothetical protein